MASNSLDAWFTTDCTRLLDERNVREVENYRDLIMGYQQLLFRAQAVPMSSSMRLSTTSDLSKNAKAEADAMQLATQKYLTTIQSLEKELSEKNAQLAQYAGNQLQLVNESKELLQAREQWEFQLQFFTKRLEEEMLMNEEKDKALKDLDGALRLLREELARQKELYEKETTGLREQIRQLEEQLLQKSAVMQEWLLANNSPDAGPARASSGMPSQEMSEQMSQLFLNSSVKCTSRVVTRVVHSIRAHATEVNSVCFNASGKVLFSGSSDGTVRAWETATCRPIGEYRGIGTAHPLLCVRVSEDGEMVLGTGCDRKCFVWRVGPGRVFQTLTGHKGKVLAAEFSLVTPNEVITGSSDRSMRVWDIAKGRSLQTINCRSSCNDIAMGVGGQFASAHQDGAVRFWDARTKHSVKELTGLHTEQVTSVSFPGDGAPYMLTNSRDHTLQVIDQRTYEVVRTLRHPGYQCGFDWSKASLSPDGVYAAAGGSSGSVFIWNAHTGKLEKENSTGHHGAVASCVWRPDGTNVASCDKNGSLVLWE
ncbi:TPA: hypothetical protein N0F65_008372 [Lagenidium giganteum]|uniref:Autophagy-related protein 16 domain-containing protein n=1 Tax=Lagenidium giganteum TaxID=4803 RepID=A0AAV2YVH5_9STRA|nr:TPA: hypothetical protein N0F65_008372 [Lagenidium giganteum]